MPIALKGAGWRSSQAQRPNGNSDQQNAKEGSKKCSSPIPKYILGKPSPRDSLPRIHDVRRDDDEKEEKQNERKSYRNASTKLSENRINTNNNAREYEDEKEGEEEEHEQDDSGKNVNSNREISENDRGEIKERNTRLPKEPSSAQGAGYCRKVVKRSEKSFPRVPNYGPYSNLLPDSYKMPWKQVYFFLLSTF